MLFVDWNGRLMNNMVNEYTLKKFLLPVCKGRQHFVCMCLGFTAQSTSWGHVEHDQFTLPHLQDRLSPLKWLTSIVHNLSPETDNCPS